MITMTLCFCIKIIIVLVKANDGHDEAKLMQLIVCYSKTEQRKEGGRDRDIQVLGSVCT